MRFDRESYRKLYVRESAEDRMMPILARGLRDYLLRHAQEDGTLLRKTRDPKGDLAVALSVGKPDLARFKDAVGLLLESEYLSFAGARLWITRYEEAQEARTPGAKRTASYRARKAAQDASPEASQETSHDASLGTSPETSQVTSPLADETRREIPPTPRAGQDRGKARFEASFSRLRDDVTRVHEHWKASTGLSGHRLKGSSDLDAMTLAEAIDAHGEADCMLVAATCMQDRMVNGEADERGQKHTKIQYIFGNEHTFARILKAAQETAGKSLRADADAEFEAAMGAAPR
jgi:hypothetical protein